MVGCCWLVVVMAEKVDEERMKGSERKGGRMNKKLKK